MPIQAFLLPAAIGGRRTWRVEIAEPSALLLSYGYGSRSETAVTAPEREKPRI